MTEQNPQHPDTEKLPDEEIVTGAQQLAAETGAQVATDLQAANEINEELAGNGQPVVEQIAALQNEIKEEVAAFAAKTERLSSPYVISPELKIVVRVTRNLKKLLLLEGEPGTGKTSLAYAIAGHEDLPIIHVRGKSTLTAQSLLYEIDNVARLKDVYLSSEIPQSMREQAAKWTKHLEEGGDPSDEEFMRFMQNLQRSAQFLNLERISNIKNYVRYGAFGEAIIRAARGETVLLLIDEVDKAKRELTNDLLDEFDYSTF